MNDRSTMVLLNGNLGAPSSWREALGNLVLNPDEIHVWRVSLDRDPSLVQRMDLMLSTEERARAAHFRFSRDRDRFTVRRGMLRALLGLYLDIDPADVQFCYNRYGKPSLAMGTAADALRFNLAHSSGLALFAVAPGREVGIDIERVQPDLAEDRIAQRFFSPGEAAALRALPQEAQTDAFYACWTRKEAYIKARGLGMSLPLDRFAVSLAPGEPAALLSNEDDPAEVLRWTLRELKPGPGFAAALAVEGHEMAIKCWEWSA